MLSTFLFRTLTISLEEKRSHTMTQVQEIHGLQAPVKMSILPNGLTVITAETDSQIMEVQFVLRVGAMHDPKGQEGIAHYLEHVLCEGPARDGVHPKFKILQKKAVLVNAITDRISTRYFAIGLSDDFREILHALHSMVFEPDFTEKTVAGKRAVIIQEMNQKKNSTRFSHWRGKILLPEFSCHARCTTGTRSSLQRMSKQKLEAFYSLYYSFKNALCIVAGGVSHEQVLDIISHLPETQSATTLSCPPLFYPSNNITKEYKSPYGDSALHLSFDAPNSLREDIYLNVVSRMLCSPPFGLLHTSLRLEKKIVYGVSFKFEPFPVRCCAIIIQTQQRYFEDVIRDVCDKIKEIKNNAFDAALFEYQEVCQRMYMIEQLEKSKKDISLGDLRHAWLRGEYDFDDIRYGQEMTRDALVEVANTYLDYTRASIITVVPALKK